MNYLYEAKMLRLYIYTSQCNIGSSYIGQITNWLQVRKGRIETLAQVQTIYIFWPTTTNLFMLASCLAFRVNTLNAFGG